ncbi:MAG: class I SAM-dependent RNA methyltransferase [Chthoniobacterales bacterium]
MRNVEVQVKDVAFGGKGVGRVEGKAVFVPFTIEDERVRARITREKKNFAEAELTHVLEASAHRATPECPYFGRCGGCSYQHIAYQHQLEIKAQQVEAALRRLGRIEDPPMRPIIPSPTPYAYRNRITVHAEDGVVGYFRRDVHRLIDVERCPIAVPEVNAALAELRARRPRDGHFTLRAHAGPRIFAQTNDAVADALAAHVRDLLPPPRELLIDAYCGAGFFAKRLLANFQRIIGIEWDRFAISAAQENATPTESYLAGDVELTLAQLLRENDSAATSVIVDPPATGLPAGTRSALLEHPPATLVYVSCNPPTLARDLGELQKAFTVLSVTPLDMFPQTAEIECVVHLQNANLSLISSTALDPGSASAR